MSDQKTPDPKGISPLHASPTGGSRLAHWPPPTFGHELRPLPIKHRTTEKVHHGTRRGWRLTRAMFSEFEGDED